MALQTTPISIQHLFERHIPSVIWQDLIQQMNISSCSQEQSLYAKEKIIQIATLLRENS